MADSANQGRQLKTIDPEHTEFMANGKLYKIEGGLSIERFAELQAFEQQIAYNMTIKGLYEKLTEQAKFIDKMQFGKAAINCNDILRGLLMIQEKEPIVIKICALFMNTENEDRTVFSQDLINTKKADWNVEGINIQYFFTQAFNLAGGFIEIYKMFTRLTSDLETSLATGNL